MLLTILLLWPIASIIVAIPLCLLFKAAAKNDELTLTRDQIIADGDPYLIRLLNPGICPTFAPDLPGAADAFSMNGRAGALSDSFHNPRIVSEGKRNLV